MDEPEDLLTLSEVVDRLRDAGLCKNDRSRRSRLDQLIRHGTLTDYLVLEPGRTRASRYDKRISAAAVEQLLAGRTASARASSTHPRDETHGLNAVEELVARVDALMQSRQASRDAAQRLSRDHENELHELRQRLLDLEHQATLAEIDGLAAQEHLRDEVGTRQTYENVITQLIAPNDPGDLLGQR